MLLSSRFWFLAALWVAPAAAADKSRYHLGNPTPDAELRELSTDRPDKTESAYTVDAGRLQVEADLAAFTREVDHAAGADTHDSAWGWATLNLKLGLRHDLDAQMMVETYARAKSEDRVSGSRSVRSGFGDITVRLKKNFWGNDGGRTAFAAMPFVKLPTNRDGLGNDSVEGGLILPLAVELPAGWGMGLMTEIDWLADDVGGGRHHAFINSVTFARDIAGNLGGYVELFTERDETNPRWRSTLDLGLTYGIGRNLQLDGGVNFGLTEAADDLMVFFGFGRRF